MAFSAATFLERFLLPLVAGGEVEVREPLDAEDLAALVKYCATPEGVVDAVAAIEQARGEVAAVCWLYPVATPLDDEALRLAVGLHNALFLGHPAAGRLSVRRAALERVVAFSARCLSLGTPPHEESLVARHALLARLPELERTDIELTFWIGRRSFVGMEPPARLLAWSGVRRVQQRRQTVCWLSSELVDAQRRLVDLLFWQSPLTALLSPERTFPCFSLAPLFPYLAHREVSRVVCQRYLQLGLARVGPVIARDFWRIAAAPSAPFAAMTRGQRRWLRTALTRFAGVDGSSRIDDGEAEGSSAADEAAGEDRLAASLPLRVVVGLVQYLYAAECLSGEPELPAMETGEVTAELCTVLAAAAESGLLVETGDAEIDTRLQDLAERARANLGNALPQLVGMLRAALAR